MKRPTLAAVLATTFLVAGCGGGGDPPDLVPGSTLRATIADPDGDGTLAAASGEPLLDRTDLAPAGEGPAREVARLAQIADAHVRDEESPLRVPFLDRLGPPVTSTFRPQEAVSPQVLAAEVRAIAAERPQAVLLTGDNLDNAQRNELDQLLVILRGGTVDPDSGAPGYDGVQAASNPDGLFYRPAVDAPSHPGVLDRAQRPFASPGLRPPWHAVLGNHDLLVQGELPPTEATDAVATGDRALLTFAPELEDLLDEVPRDPDDASPDLRNVPPATIERLLEQVASDRAATVPPDPRRRAVTEAELEAALPTESFDLGASLRVILLDTVDRSGGSGGVLQPGQIELLRRELKSATDRAIIVVDHHGLDRTEGGGEALVLLAEDPRVVAEVSGDTHRHEVRARSTPAGGFWQITTASLADWPQQGRMIRLVETADGRRALETWVVDHTGAIDGSDPAGFGRELAFLDAQGGRPNTFAGLRADRNVRLWLPPR